jgi:hypothetical protein
MSLKRDFLPHSDAGLLEFTANFSRLISNKPAQYGLGDAIVEAYQALQEDFSAKLTAAVDPGTRGKRTVFLKDESRKLLVAETRKIAKQINGMISVTNDQRQALGLTIAETKRTPAPVPQQKPFIKVLKMDGRTVSIRLQQDSSRRGKPAKVMNATILTHTGPTMPTASSGWDFVTNTGKTQLDIPFAPSATGDTVWITAFWNNERNESGPAATPLQINLPAGGAMPTETAQEKLKIAA